MKKQKPTVLAKVNPNVLAKDLKKKLGEDKAFKVADSLAKNLSEITGDATNLFTPKEISRNARIWTQVRNILNK
jgi:hypothetical protein